MTPDYPWRGKAYGPDTIGTRLSGEGGFPTYYPEMAATAGDDPAPVARPRWPLVLGVLLVVLAAVLLAWSAGR